MFANVTQMLSSKHFHTYCNYSHLDIGWTTAKRSTVLYVSHSPNILKTHWMSLHYSAGQEWRDLLHTKITPVLRKLQAETLQPFPMISHTASKDCDIVGKMTSSDCEMDVAITSSSSTHWLMSKASCTDSIPNCGLPMMRNRSTCTLVFTPDVWSMWLWVTH